tara:strand:+ start:447 stop:1088 length:642 start_codon:yes stop_codon:yes gene_type:complete
MPTFTHKPTGKRLFFAHIPRTAGRYVEANLLWKNDCDWDEINLDTGLGVMTMMHGAEIAHWHKEIYEEHLDVKDIPNFSIIRNPFDKFISGSVYLKRLYGNDCQELFEDENLFFSMLANIPTLDPNFSANWFKSQVDFMTDRTHIWKYEDGMGENFVSWLSGIMGVDLEFDEDIEYPKSRDEGNKLKKTPKLIHNLRQLYRKDIELYYPELEA